MFDLSMVNWLAVVVAGISSMVVGAIWYGPLFGNYWMAQTGRTAEEMSGAMSAYIVSALASIVLAAALAIFLTVFDTVDLAIGIAVAVAVAVGFVGTTTLVNGTFENRKPSVTALFVGYEVVSLAIMGAILGAWR
jgi:hypothetical protein